MPKYNIKLNLEIEFFDTKVSHRMCRKALEDILSSQNCFKKVKLLNYDGNTMNDENPFSDIRSQILEEARGK